MQKRRVILAIATAVALGQASVFSLAHAQKATFPSKPIRMIVPFAPGGVSDTSARIVAEKMSQHLGQSVVVENKPGASGNIGAQQVAQSEPDGYTILLGFDGTLVINPHLQKVPFDPVKSFTPIGKIGDASLIIVVNPKIPVKNFTELLAYARTQPGGLSYGSAGTGSTPHLAGESLKQRTGIPLTHIPYKGGGQAMSDVVGGSLPMLFTAVAGAYGFVKNKQVQAIGVSGAARVTSLPEVPTLTESGVDDFVFDSWTGLLAPAGTPRPIIDTLNHALNASLTAADTKARLADLGIAATPGSPEDYAHQIRNDLQKNKSIVEAAKIAAQP